eukprot:gene55048-75428_t
MEFDLEAHYGHREKTSLTQKIFDNSSPQEGTTIATIIDRSPDRSAAEKSTAKYAYVTLLSGIDKSLRYRGFLYNALIIKRALNQLGSTADFITLIGY